MGVDKKLKRYETVAEAVRIEHDVSEDRLYIVFEITDDIFKQRIKKNWMEDIELKLVGRKLEEVKGEVK